MSERRPHWDDDLLQAVYDAVFQRVDRDSGGVYEDVLPDVIAAVEDWQAQHEIVSAPAALIDAVQRAAIAETQVRRVRQVAERFASESGPDPYGFGVARAVAADAVLDALDGDG